MGSIDAQTKVHTTEGTDGKAQGDFKPKVTFISRFNMQFWRTRMCKSMVECGHCDQGDRCGYAHSEEELLPSVNLEKTSMCPVMRAGQVCGDAECRYGHSREDLVTYKQFLKTKACRFLPRGKCQMGEECAFSHDITKRRRKKKKSKSLVAPVRELDGESTDAGVSDLDGREDDSALYDTSTNPQNSTSPSSNDKNSMRVSSGALTAEIHNPTTLLLSHLVRQREEDGNWTRDVEPCIAVPRAALPDPMWVMETQLWGYRA